MSRRKKQSVKITNDVVLTRYAYGIICIVVSLIALLYEPLNTGFLGALLCNCARWLCGNIWFVLYGALILFGVVYLLLNKKIQMGRIVACFICLYIAALMFCAMPTDKSIVGNAIFDNFFVNSKEIFNGTVDAQGGLIGCFLYGFFSYFMDYIGALIVMLAIVVFAGVIAFNDGELTEWFKAIFKKQKSKQQMRAVEKQKRNDEKQKRASEKQKTAKEKSTFLEVDQPKKKQDKKKLFVNDSKPIKPIIKDSDISKDPIIEDYFKEDPTEEIPVPVLEKKPIKVETPLKTVTAPISTVETAPVKQEGALGGYNEKNYKLPKLMTLEAVSVPKKGVNSKNAVEKWNELSEILESFGLPSSLSTYNIGPSVTQFEIVPEGNFNIRKYSTIEENIKMQLAVRDVRIEAPIPGKKAVGIEIPNVEKVAVRLRELLQNVPSEYENQPLMMALGKDLSGNGVYGRIDKMPHLLIAGATGSGKSVCINSIILTLLLRTRPDQVKLLMIDPKKVEFTPYEKVPHLVCPIINDTTKAAESLKKLVQLMEQRYDLFVKTGARNITEYNAKSETKMCNIVCIIDELADLMLTHGKEVEQYIARLAAMARASGIFMILATQRPSTDVITGTIKNNIVSRIAFAVSSSYDSRTIIDRVGAEALFGNGDMLYMPAGVNSPNRVQGVYVSDQEIANVVNYFKESGYLPRYEDIFMIDENAEENSLVGGNCDDPLYAEIKKWVMTQKTISASGLQRRCGLGFPRAAKIIDALEQDGIISGSNGSKPRDVLAQIENQE